MPANAAFVTGTSVDLRRRLAITGGVLLAEYLAISLRFDALSVVERGGLWAWVGRVGAIAPIAIVVVTVLILLRGSTPEPASRVPEKPSVLLLGVHAACFAAFYAVTTHVFGSDAPAGRDWVWIGLFALAALGSLASLLVGLLGVRMLLYALSWSTALALGIGVMGWLAGSIATELWSVLSASTLSVVAWMLRPFVPIHADPPTLELVLEDFGVIVSRECSGLEGIGLITVLLSAYLVTFRDRLRVPHALVLLPLGVVAAWFGNSVRIAILMLVGAYVDSELAYGGFHSKLGWVLFCAVALGIAALGLRVRWFRAGEDGGDEPANDEVVDNPTAAFLMPALALTATALVTTMFVRDVDRYYGLRLVAAGIALFAYRRYYGDLPKTGSLLAVGIGLVIGAVWVLTTPSSEEQVLVEVDWFWLTTRTVGSVLVIPVVEELAFRGCLLRWLVSRDFTSVPFTEWRPLAIVGSSLAFGLLHERWVSATIVGALYAAIQLRRGRIGDAIFAHAATNGVVSAAALWTGDLSLWS